MTSKEYLSQYKALQGTIDRLKSDLRTEEAKRDAISINYDGMPRGTDISRRTENIAIKITDLQQEIKESIDEAKALQNEIKLVIEGLGKGLDKPWKWEIAKEVLTAIYLTSYEYYPKTKYLPTPYQIVERKLPYSRGTIRAYHDLGLKEVDNEIQG